MADYATALRHLREAEDALAAADLAAAERALREHDRALRAACEGPLPPPRTELEALAAGQQALLRALCEVRERVSQALVDTRRGTAAARAYLGNAGG